jgi:purine-binding chemotaxis protein CheW
MTLHVLFKVADADYALPASDVLHMETFTGATRVPGTLAYVAGLVQIRSRVVPVIDLRARFGLAAHEPTMDSRVVVVQWSQRVLGLLTDSAREILEIAPDAFKPPPEVMAHQAAGFVTAVAQVGARLIMLIDYTKVIGEEVLHGHE